MTKEILIVSMACWAIGILTGGYVMRLIYKTKAEKAMKECERYMKHITPTIRDTMVLKSRIEVPIVAEVTEEDVEDIKHRLALDLSRQIATNMNFEMYKDPALLENVFSAWIRIVTKEH